ncbi:hypothetical protein GO002_30525 [Streptomyces eurocidicus]|uniref:hypothetical protein n=1 Tax=Streptomyces eurocidicus TaxID=66423 RepID=UPI0018929276|nr:hypothetical protein [Streptomyces eurocidicus]MBF6056167.1 hypothetical protein [Streptomyces eurocidicus]
MTAVDFPYWSPRDLADAAKMNARVRDPLNQLANPARLAAAGVSTVKNVPDTGGFKTLVWDAVESSGGWTNTPDTFTVPTTGTYFVTGDFTALSPKDITRRPALVLTVVAQTGQGEKEWLRSYNSVIIPGTYLTCSLRGVVHATRGDRVSLRAFAVPGTGEWEVSAGSRTSSQLNHFSAVLLGGPA